MQIYCELLLYEGSEIPVWIISTHFRKETQYYADDAFTGQRLGKQRLIKSFLSDSMILSWASDLNRICVKACLVVSPSKPLNLKFPQALRNMK